MTVNGGTRAATRVSSEIIVTAGVNVDARSMIRVETTGVVTFLLGTVGTIPQGINVGNQGVDAGEPLAITHLVLQVDATIVVESTKIING